MKEVRSGDTVKVHYTGRLKDDTVFDSSQGRPPLEFTVGGGQVIPGFDTGVLGMKEGDSKSIEIEAADAYGEHRGDLVFEVERSGIPENIELEEGIQLEMSQKDGNRIIVKVTGMTDEKVTLDANHPLAGKPLFFDIELVEIA